MKTRLFRFVPYNTGSKRELFERVNAALPFMDGDMQELAVRALQKIDALTEAEFAGLAVFAADDE